jgi:YegS/Rv2252/BmrU family lipid kinase
LIIANPSAGRAGSLRKLSKVVDGLERLGCAVAVRRAGPTVGDVERLAREVDVDCDAVVAAGGDGTVNAVLNGLAAAPHGRTIPFAVLPFGTVNLLAREIGLPNRSDCLADIIAHGRARPVWPGQVGERLFLVVASSGFDAETVASVDPAFKADFGRLAIFWAGIRRLWDRPLGRRIVRIDSDKYQPSVAIVAKGRFYAGSFVAVPRASIFEPDLHVALLPGDRFLSLLRYVFGLLSGVLPQMHDVTIRKCRQVWIEAANAEPVQADGEIVAWLPVSIHVAQKPMLIICP